MKSLSARLIAVLFAACCTSVLGVAAWSALGDRATADLNGDGRPDLWRHFDAGGRLVRIDVDSNFDGRPDVAEYYADGRLVRRESDRDFDGQADLVEDFDADTRGRTRAVVDVDYDGTADTLVLFRDGLPVYSTSTCLACRAVSHAAAVDRSHAAPLAPLADPFRSEAALTARHAAADDPDYAGLSTSGGLPGHRLVACTRLAPSSRVAVADARPRTPAPLLPRSPRAPPAA